MPKTILVCDDDPLLVDIVAFRLQARDFVVEVARDGAEALAKIGEVVPDAIVLDAMMPVMDGSQVLRRLRADPATANIPVIMLSARKQETDVVGALELGANDYMVKPFSPEELVVRLTRLLGQGS
jgi:DNA-binding response OmpR family regulator